MRRRDPLQGLVCCAGGRELRVLLWVTGGAPFSHAGGYDHTGPFSVLS